MHVDVRLSSAVCGCVPNYQVHMLRCMLPSEQGSKGTQWEKTFSDSGGCHCSHISGETRTILILQAFHFLNIPHAFLCPSLIHYPFYFLRTRKKASGVCTGICARLSVHLSHCKCPSFLPSSRAFYVHVNMTHTLCARRCPHVPET